MTIILNLEEVTEQNRHMVGGKAHASGAEGMDDLCLSHRDNTLIIHSFKMILNRINMIMKLSPLSFEVLPLPPLEALNEAHHPS
jgi:hypothetical protein